MLVYGLTLSIFLDWTLHVSKIAKIARMGKIPKFCNLSPDTCACIVTPNHVLQKRFEFACQYCKVNTKLVNWG